VNKISSNNDTLLESLVLYTRLFHKPFSKESLLSGLPIDVNLTEQALFSQNNSKSLFSRAAFRAGLKTTIIERKVDEILQLQLPVILVLSNKNSCILESFNEDKTKAKIIFSSVEEPLEEWVDIKTLESEYLGFAFMLRKFMNMKMRIIKNIRFNASKTLVLEYFRIFKKNIFRLHFSFYFN